MNPLSTERIAAVVSSKTRLYYDEPLSAHTTFKTGGNAALLAEAANAADFIKLVKYFKLYGIPYFILGNGSNVLAADSGYDGAVIKPVFDGFVLKDGRIMAGAGAALSALCSFAAANGFTGLEFASGIPGTVGGAVAMNAGAYGKEMALVLCEAIIYDEKNGAHLIGASKLGLSYRKCQTLEEGALLIQAFFKLQPGDKAKIREETAQLLKKRAQSQPLDMASAGSTFKRPKDGYAGKLIEECGLKGYRIGRAAVSEKHAGFIVNLGGATSSDIFALISHVKRTVNETTGVSLEPEIRLLGDFPTW